MKICDNVHSIYEMILKSLGTYPKIFEINRNETEINPLRLVL